jgi:predicted nucleotidyltransferase
MDSKELLNSSELKSIRTFFRKNEKHVEDVVAIGSSVKGKLRPRDLDLILILKDNGEKVRLVGELSEIINAHISTVSLENLFKEPLWMAVVQEGFSVIHNRPVSEILGLESKVLFKLNLSNLEHKDRVRFNYALRGRSGGEGLLQGAGGEERGSCLIFPTQKESEVELFLDLWKVKYKPMRILAW